uniref:Uncharacterized protein n=1 Tax=Meloidogyne enterolobii TaxID=390850 RepID=A0A6V7X746_MELEN|nr:unnamed protein product [Meloidogyne enterolobii]
MDKNKEGQKKIFLSKQRTCKENVAYCQFHPKSSQNGKMYPKLLVSKQMVIKQSSF